MAITATVTPGTTPPSVTVVASGGTGFVERLENGVATTVRGTHAGFVGTILDYEIPQETVVSYRFAGATSALVEMPDVGVWLIPAGRSELACRLRVETYPSWSRPDSSSQVEVPGRENPVVVSTTARGARRGSMVVMVRGLDDFAATDACLEVTGPMLMSSPSSQWPLVSRALWVTVGSVEEEPVEDTEPTWLLTLPLTPIDRPEVVAAEAGHRWVDKTGVWRAQLGSWSQQ